jgi:hypothetical protein
VGVIGKKRKKKEKKMGEAFWRTKQPPALFVEEKCL